MLLRGGVGLVDGRMEQVSDAFCRQMRTCWCRHAMQFCDHGLPFIKTPTGSQAG